MKKFEFPWQKATRLKAEAKIIEDKRYLVIRQKTLGEKLTNTLKIAALNNLISNVLPDGRLSKMSAIRITTLPSNDDCFSIFPIMDGDPSVGNIPFGGGYQNIFQIDINLSKTGQELHFFNCPYGPEFSWDISRIDDFTKYCVSKVQNFTMFPRL